MRIIEGTACSGCTGQVALVLHDLKNSGELAAIVRAIGEINVVYGADAPIPGEGLQGACLFIGKCQHESRHLGMWVPGCPVHVAILEDALRYLAGFPIRYPAWFEVDYE
jgi:hypothetical protein